MLLAVNGLKLITHMPFSVLLLSIYHRQRTFFTRAINQNRSIANMKTWKFEPMVNRLISGSYYIIPEQASKRQITSARCTFLSPLTEKYLDQRERQSGIRNIFMTKSS